MQADRTASVPASRGHGCRAGGLVAAAPGGSAVMRSAQDMASAGKTTITMKRTESGTRTLRRVGTGMTRQYTLRWR